MQTVVNVLDFVVAFITIIIQYPHIGVIMYWCALCVRTCIRACVRACVRACMYKTLCQKVGEIDLSRIILK